MVGMGDISVATPPGGEATATSYTLSVVDFNAEKYAAARIIDRRDCGADLWVIRIRSDLEITFRSGQYVTLGLPRAERVIERPYSICSDPAEDAIELFIERVPEGELSAPLWTLQAGEEVLIRKRCKGLFLKDATAVAEPHLLVATVTGVAPYVSLVRSLRRRQLAGEWAADFPVTILQGASHEHELGYTDELRKLDAECDWFTYVPTLSRPWDNPEWRGETGRVEDVMRKHADAIGLNTESGGVYLCGHPGMISNGRTIMRRAGLLDAAIREEQYWPD
jgi:ferredoxin--NADP+ reductase